MKTIPEIDLKDAVTLTPQEMNAIHFDTGDRSHLLTPEQSEMQEL